jgi:hypothetical protein
MLFFGIEGSVTYKTTESSARGVNNELNSVKSLMEKWCHNKQVSYAGVAETQKPRLSKTYIFCASLSYPPNITSSNINSKQSLLGVDLPFFLVLFLEVPVGCANVVLEKLSNRFLSTIDLPVEVTQHRGLSRASLSNNTEKRGIVACCFIKIQSLDRRHYSSASRTIAPA